MSKRKAFIITKAPESKPRKRQAVTKTYKKSTIALIQHNAANSPLLSLPSEVRERILKHLLGDKLIHVKYLNKHQEEDYNTARNLLKAHAEKEGSFRHTTCSNIRSLEAQEESLVDSSHHKNCIIYENDCREREPIVLSASAHCPMKNALVILSVCRQLYEESNFILWATNTFSFDHGGSLIKFVTSLNGAQKRNLKKLHMILNPHQHQDNNSYGGWFEACASKYLSMFRGIESLSLCIEHYLSHSHYTRPMETGDESWKRCLERLGLLRLRVLPIKHLNLAISNDTPKYIPQSVSVYLSVYHLSEELKAKYAEDLSKKLLDPQGADVQKGLDAEASKCYRETAAKHHEIVEATRLRRAREKVQASRLRLQWFEGYATKCESAADQTLASLNVGDNAHKAYARLEIRAQKARATADKAADTLQVWKGRLSQRQKLADAKVAREAKMAKGMDADLYGSESTE